MSRQTASILISLFCIVWSAIGIVAAVSITVATFSVIVAIVKTSELRTAKINAFYAEQNKRTN